MQDKKFRVLAHTGVNKASLGDIYSIDNELVVVTNISKKYAYLDGIPHNLKEIGTMKRNFINQWTAGKSITTHW